MTEHQMKLPLRAEPSKGPFPEWDVIDANEGIVCRCYSESDAALIVRIFNTVKKRDEALLKLFEQRGYLMGIAMGFKMELLHHSSAGVNADERQRRIRAVQSAIDDCAWPDAKAVIATDGGAT